MKLQRVFTLCLLWVLCAININAQVSDSVQGGFQAMSDSAIVADSIRRDVVNKDSLLVTQLQQLLEEAKLSEANLRMEYEQFKLSILASDSIKRHKHRI